MLDVSAVILAAGHGTRMKSRLLKVMHPLGGKPIVAHVVDNCRRAGIERIVLVVGYQQEKVRAHFGESVAYAVQEPQLGTGHAAMQAEPLLRDAAGDLLVILGDNPFLGPDVIARFLAAHRDAGAAGSLLTAVVDEPGALGRILRRPDGALDRVVEYKDATPEQREIREVNSGIFLFRLPDFWQHIRRIDNRNAQQEYYLADVMQVMEAAGQTVQAVPAAGAADLIAPNDRKELAVAEATLRQQTLDRLMAEGVTVVDPATTWVSAGARIGRDTTIYPFTFVEGETVIGEECRIGPNTRLISAVLGNEVEVQMSVVEHSRIGDGSRIGPFAHVRPGCDLGPDSEIGNYAELKKTRTGRGMKMHHHSYLGDAVVGDGVNIGAGVITCNYDGFQKHQTVLEDASFIGTNVNLVAPIRVGRGGYIAAGSTVNQEVPPDALAIARAPQVTKEGRAARMRSIKAAGKVTGTGRQDGRGHTPNSET